MFITISILNHIFIILYSFIFIFISVNHDSYSIVILFSLVIIIINDSYSIIVFNLVIFIIYIVHHSSSCVTSNASSTMTDVETAKIIQPRYSKLEERLDLKPILGKLFSKELFNKGHKQELQSKDTCIEQNRAFLDYLLTQPVEQMKTFCQVLQEDVCNASHQELAEEMLTAITPVDPWKRMPHSLQIIANQISKSPDTCAVWTLLKQAIPSVAVEVQRSNADDSLLPLLSNLLNFYQTKVPQDPHLFLAYLPFVLEVATCKGVTDVTPVCREIFDIETANIIQPRYSKLEERLDLRPLIGTLYSKKLFNEWHKEELQSKDTRIKQNRAFLDYLLTQPVEQMKTFCQVLQEDDCNASHQELAEEMLMAITPVDPWKRMPHSLQIIANQISKSPDTCAVWTLLKQAIPSVAVEVQRSNTDESLLPLLSNLLDFYQTKVPQNPHLFLVHLPFVLEVATCKGVTDVTAVHREILRVSRVFGLVIPVLPHSDYCTGLQYTL